MVKSQQEVRKFELNIGFCRFTGYAFEGTFLQCFYPIVFKFIMCALDTLAMKMYQRICRNSMGVARTDRQSWRFFFCITQTFITLIDDVGSGRKRTLVFSVKTSTCFSSSQSTAPPTVNRNSYSVNPPFLNIVFLIQIRNFLGLTAQVLSLCGNRCPSLEAENYIKVRPTVKGC